MPSSGAARGAGDVRGGATARAGARRGGRSSPGAGPARPAEAGARRAGTREPVRREPRRGRRRRETRAGVEEADVDLSAPVPSGRPYPAALPPEPSRNPRLRCPRCTAGRGSAPSGGGGVRHA
ncbi:hypothetical protein SHJG_5330 [Streptomyces hygroscopicus subsp. jinggangensis 5008]|nr:hypothetical protein SHJG_5330 [Streptomyces hygroscopicus subsp. jinggangensis 5008]AGF64757.1 hypothetical protein SHJGH_5094 [Streptomyces hygroscopicus subsp. jinggangensis TL01]